MQNNNNKPASSARKSRVPKSSKKSRNAPKLRQSQPQRERNAPAARFTDMTRTVGMKDLRAHEVSYVAGFIYVGNGTNGATDGVYFRANGNNIVPAQGGYVAGGGQVPVLPCDPKIGQTYVSDIEKHFSRKRYRKMKLTLVSLQPSTANSMVVAVAPVRGCGQAGESAVAWATTDGGATLQNTLGMAGAKSCASWESLTLDMSPYVAGGSGSDQKEFNTAIETTDTNNWGEGPVDLDMIAPCAFIVAGQNSTTALRGTNTHYVLVSFIVDYLDFIAGNAVQLPSALFSEDDLRTLFRLVMTSGEKSVRDSAGIKRLIAWAAAQC